MPLLLNYLSFLNYTFKQLTAFFTVTAFILLIATTAKAQTTGSLGDPVVDITFGAGTATHGGALPTGTTNYTYSSADFPIDGSYTVENTTNSPNVWWTTTDHTGDTGGYMMVVNASYAKTDYFYKHTVSGLCSGTTYQFGAWIMNLLRNQDNSPPNITFSVTTASGVVLGSYSTGPIPITTSAGKGIWKQFVFNFTTTSTEDVVIQMTNNANGGAPANDLALDDITFTPYGSQVVASFGTTASATTSSTCAGSSQVITINSQSTLASGYVQKPQMLNTSGTWVDIGTASTATSFSITIPTTAGTYSYRLVSASSDNISSSSCYVASNVLTLTVTAGPTAAFSYSGTCYASPTVFTDNSTASGTTITGWAWAFGDGSTATTQTSSHTYTSAGTYTVTLTVTSASGCTSTTTQTITISSIPTASFTISTSDCVGQPVTFTDNSTVTNGTISQWVWNYGDGSTETLSTNAAHTHTYTTAGNYIVSLTVIATTGCSSSASTQTITVNSVAVVDFTLPDVCLNDAYAQFTDQSTISYGSQAGITYLWNFGDANATTANSNTSALQNPKHKYTKAALYNVTLTVTTASGCSTSKIQSLSVNGENPVAGFTISSTSVCSDQTALFTDNSYVADFGNITKIIWYFDYDNNPAVYETYTDPVKGTTYPHIYPVFYYPTANKKYHVVLKAYSGGTCVNIADSYITSLPVPVIKFDTLTPVCINAGTVQLTGKETTGISGAASYTGTGITTSGVFDPTIAGVGTTNITYTFTATDGCAESLIQPITVYAVPSITVSPKFTILDGGSITLDAKIVGDSTGLTYQWSPATGLSSSTVLNPVANPTDDTQYILTVTTKTGCTVTATTLVKVLKAPIVPNTFTPNGDGVNDVWNIEYLSSYLNSHIDVYNRYGNKVYSSIGYATPWDGTFQGSNLPVGVYYYIIDPKNGRKIISGYVTILR